eukprot:14675211-Alexandrium_andersonii.AAC.1
MNPPRSSQAESEPVLDLPSPPPSSLSVDDGQGCGRLPERLPSWPHPAPVSYTHLRAHETSAHL